MCMSFLPALRQAIHKEVLTAPVSILNGRSSPPRVSLSTKLFLNLLLLLFSS